MLWERTPEQVIQGLIHPDHLSMFWNDLQRKPYRSIFLDDRGNFRQDRIPRLELRRAKTLLDSSEEAVVQYYRSFGEEPSQHDILAARREFADWYVGGLWVPEVGYIAEVWAPVYGLPFDETGNAGGIIIRYGEFPTPVATLPYETERGELYWAWIHENGNPFSVLIPEKDSSGRIVGFKDSPTGYRYAVVPGELPTPSRVSLRAFGANYAGMKLLLEGQPIHLQLKGEW
ncbi:MAG: hypothetical protein KatS3mg070_2700 [Meiothermus sp.]|nr:MAG: hypothetical protein KatS3mg070_2700 [Meiothermus sp.]